MSGSVYDNGGLVGKANNPSNPVGMWSPAAQYDAVIAGVWPANWSYTNGFEGTTVANSATLKGDFTGTLDILQDNGSISTADKFAGSKSYYANSRTTATNRLLFAIDPANINKRRFFILEFYWKFVSGDNFASSFDMFGGSATQRFYFRSAGDLYASSAGDFNVNNNTGWCTWTNWNKFTIKIDRSLATNNATIAVNDVVKNTGTTPQTWTAYSGGKVYISFFQLIDSAASDNGVEGYLDSIQMRTPND